MRLGVIVNLQRPEARPTFERIRLWAEKQGWPIVACQEIDMVANPRFQGFPEGTFADNIDLLLALGGDGTMLTAVRAVARLGIPVLGINLGSLGFLTVAPPDMCVEALERVRRGDYFTEERLMLEVTRPHVREDCWVVLNDIALLKSGIARMVNLTVLCNGEYVSSMAGDGLIVATPTGSTAYSLSVGGPILMPTMRGFILTPVSPHTLAQRPMVFDEDAHMEITVDSVVGDAVLTIDGQIALHLEEKSTVAVRVAPFQGKLIHFHDHSFFQVLREKLHWGISPSPGREHGRGEVS